MPSIMVLSTHNFNCHKCKEDLVGRVAVLAVWRYNSARALFGSLAIATSIVEKETHGEVAIYAPQSSQSGHW
jgi:hypothetical protein